MADQVKFSIEEAILRRGKDAELLILVASLVSALGNKVVITLESLKKVMELKELVIIRNDLDDEGNESITLRVDPYEDKDIN